MYITKNMKHKNREIFRKKKQRKCLTRHFVFGESRGNNKKTVSYALNKLFFSRSMVLG